MKHLTLLFVSLFLSLFVAAAPAAMADHQEYVSGELLIELTEPGYGDVVASQYGLEVVATSGEIWHLRGDEAMLDDIVEELSEDPRVRWTERNAHQRTPEAVRQMVLAAIGGTVQDFHDQQVSERIGLDIAHAVTMGAGVKVAVLDSGIDPMHELFQQRVALGYDFVDGDGTPWEESNGIDDDGDGLADAGFGHGSMVAGLIRLVAPETILLPIRVLDDEGQTDAFRVIQGIHWAVENGADVINLSLGAYRTIAGIGKTIEFAQEQGVFVVGGAGNDDRPAPALYPAALPTVAMVASVDAEDVKADFSDYSTKVWVSAPGEGLRSAYPGGWAIGSGCSFATALVTGEVALCLSERPGASASDLEASVLAGVVSIDDLSGNDGYEGRLGTGRLYIPAALEGSAASVPDGLEASPTWVTASPNPTTGEVRFDAGAAVTDRLALRVFDTAGRVVFESSFSGRQVWRAIDENGRELPEGVYLYEVRRDDRVVAVDRVVKVR